MGEGNQAAVRQLSTRDGFPPTKERGGTLTRQCVSVSASQPLGPINDLSKGHMVNISTVYVSREVIFAAFQTYRRELALGVLENS